MWKRTVARLRLMIMLISMSVLPIAAQRRHSTSRLERRLHRTHRMDVAGDEGAGIDAQRVALSLKQVRKVGQRGVERIEADRANLAEGQVDRHDNCRAGHRARLEIGEVNRREIGVLLAGAEAFGIDPERLAFEAAGRGDRRIQRDARIAPPRLAVGPAEHVAREDVALGVGHQGNVAIGADGRFGFDQLPTCCGGLGRLHGAIGA